MSKAARSGFLLLAGLTAALGIAKIIRLLGGGAEGRETAWILKQSAYAFVYLCLSGWFIWRFRSEA